MAYSPTNGYPTLAEIRSWVRVAATNLTDTELEHVADAEQTAQVAALASLAEVVGGPPPERVIPADVYQAFLRRCARHIAARGLPLGIIGVDSEFGTSRLPRWDAEVDRLEAPYVVQVVA